MNSSWIEETTADSLEFYGDEVSALNLNLIAYFKIFSLFAFFHNDSFQGNL